MSRAGFIELNIAPIQDNHFQDRNNTEEYPLHSLASIRVRIIRDDHLSPESWENDISVSRKRTLDSGVNNVKLMELILKEGSEVSDVLSHLYSNNSSRWPVVVTKICGGCPIDRDQKKSLSSYHMPVAKSISNTTPVEIGSLLKIFPQYDPKLINIFYDSSKNNDTQIIKLMKWLINEFDIKEIGINQQCQIRQSKDFINLYLGTKSKFLLVRDLSEIYDEPYTPLGRISFLSENTQLDVLNDVLKLERPIHIIILSSDLWNPNHHSRKYIDTAVNTSNLDQLIEIINK
jgi:hypothetical protein